MALRPQRIIMVGKARIGTGFRGGTGNMGAWRREGWDIYIDVYMYTDI